MRVLTIMCLVLTMSATLSFADTIQVPQDQPTIQQGIDAAQNGDTVLVAPGTYLENIDFTGKAVTVKSSDGAGLTVIDGGNPANPAKAAVVTFESGETWDSVLEGFTITNGDGNTFGYTSELGGGIACVDSSPVIRHNVIHGNAIACIHGGNAIGGGIYSDASAKIEHNTIHSNVSYGYACGGGVFCSGNTTLMHNIIRNNTSDMGGGVYCNSSAIVAYNTLFDNYAYGSGSGIEGSGHSVVKNNILFDHESDPKSVFRGAITVGGCTVSNNLIFMNMTRGIACTGSPIITNNTIHGNSESGIWCWEYGTPIINNSILWQNGSFEIELDDPGNLPIVSHCDIMGGWPGVGNIDADPLFANLAANDFHLLHPSPCRNVGDNAAVIELDDFEGDPRIVGGTVDMGADEFYSHLYYTGDAAPGGKIDLKFIDEPNTAPVILWAGSGILETPIHLKHYGDWYLQFPILFEIGLGSIPAPDGMLVLSITIPIDIPSPLDLPLQALSGSKLTNPCVLEIE